MPSETDLLNDALSQIGATAITAIDDGSVNANHCQRLYPALRDACLSMAKWHFAESREQLAQDLTGPDFGYTYSYQLPANFLRLTEYNGANLYTDLLLTLPTRILYQFKIEGQKIYTNDGSVYIVYIYRNESVNTWSPLFYQYVAALLASKLANAIAKDAKKSAGLLEQANKEFLPLALAVDGQQGSTVAIQADDLTWGR